MNSDFRVATDWPDHPKTLHLIDLAGDVAALALIRLWAYTAQHRPDGALVGLNDASVEARAGWLGPPGAFVAAILSVPPGGRFKVGYAARDRAGHLTLHDWKDHNAYASADPIRTRAAKIGAAARWSKNQPVNADRMRAASNPHDAPAPAPAPAPQAGEKNPAPRSKRASPAAEPRDGFADHAFRTWEARHGEKPPWGTSDYVALANAARSIGDDGKARKAWTRYLTETDKFFAGHPPRKFLSDLGRFLTATPKPPNAKDGAYSDPRNAGQERQYAAFREAYRAAIAAGKTREEATAAGNQAFTGAKETA